MKNAKRFFIVLGLILFVCGSLFILYAKYGLPWKYTYLKKEMTRYLESRYLDEFTLGAVYFDILHGKSYYSEATAASTGVTFSIGISRSGEFDDGYGYEHWSIYGDSLLKPYFPEALGISANVTFDEPLPRGKDVLDHLPHTYWTVYIDMPFFISDEDKKVELENLLAVIQKMDNEGIHLDYMLIGHGGDYVELKQDDLKNIQQMKGLKIADYDMWE